MEPAQKGMEPVLAGLRVRPFKFGVISNVTAELNVDPGQVKALLSEQITAPVKWEDSMRKMVARGVTEAVEFGGRVLMGFMRRIDRNVKVRPLEDLASLQSVKDASPG
jgi:[acyl-carrier-protein] S-malonyltransferase